MKMRQNEEEEEQKRCQTKREGNQSGGQLKVGKAAIDVSSKK